MLMDWVSFVVWKREGDGSERWVLSCVYLSGLVSPGGVRCGMFTTSYLMICESYILPYSAQPVLPQDRFSSSALLVPSYSTHRPLNPQYPILTPRPSPHPISSIQQPSQQHPLPTKALFTSTIFQNPSSIFNGSCSSHSLIARPFPLAPPWR